MKESKHFEIFKQALQKGLNGTSNNYETWLINNNLLPNAMNLHYIEQQINKNASNMIGNEKEISIVAEYIGLYINNPTNKFHISLIGPHGIGRTYFLSVITKFIKELKKDLKVLALDGSKFEFGAETKTEYLIKNIIKETGHTRKEIQDLVTIKRKNLTKPTEEKALLIVANELGVELTDNSEILYYNGRILNKERVNKNVDIVIIDDLYNQEFPYEVVASVAEILGNAVYITSWTPELWQYWYFDMDDAFPNTKELILKPISYDSSWIIGSNLHTISREMISFLFLIFSIICKDSNKTDIGLLKDWHELTSEIHRITGGIPRLIIELIIRSIEETFIHKKEQLNKEMLSIARSKMGLELRYNKIRALNKSQDLIIRYILREQKEKGIRPIELTKHFKKDKSTIYYHLQALIEEKLLEKETKGKYAFYKIKENLVPIIELVYLIINYIEK